LQKCSKKFGTSIYRFQHIQVYHGEQLTWVDCGAVWKSKGVLKAYAKKTFLFVERVCNHLVTVGVSILWQYIWGDSNSNSSKAFVWWTCKREFETKISLVCFHSFHNKPQLRGSSCSPEVSDKSKIVSQSQVRLIFLGVKYIRMHDTTDVNCKL